MNKLVFCLVALGAIAASSCACAQQSDHPKVLQVTREFLKPYKGGELHDKTESAFVSAMAAAHWPTHYLAVNSLSGKSRALYLTTYDTFDAWEKDTAAIMKNAALSSTLEKASHADGELLDAVDQSVFYFDEDLSYKPSNDIGHMRFLEATVFHVKPGHGKDFADLIKLAIETHKKAGTSSHWSMWELAYGGDGDAYLMLSGDKNMAEIDTGFGESKAFHEALGEDGARKFHELAEKSIASLDTELFAINPKQSYARDEWVQADPKFWKPAPMMKAVHAPAPAPVGQRPPQ
jgi:hypothetical protein